MRQFIGGIIIALLMTMLQRLAKYGKFFNCCHNYAAGVLTCCLNVCPIALVN